MSEADKIIESLKNSGRKVEEFYVSNKTSDKNVANIEADVKILKHIKNDFDWDLQHPNSRSEGELQEAKKYSSAIEHILAEREKMLKERNVANDSIIAHRFAVMQQQIEQKDKRIQELEEERDHWHGCFIVAMENSIAKEKVMDKIKEIKYLQSRTITSEAYNITQGEIIVLQELLERKK